MFPVALLVLCWMTSTVIGGGNTKKKLVDVDGKGLVASPGDRGGGRPNLVKLVKLVKKKKYTTEINFHLQTG